VTKIHPLFSSALFRCWLTVFCSPARAADPLAGVFNLPTEAKTLTLPVPGYLAPHQQLSPRRLRSAPTNAMPRWPQSGIGTAGDGRAPIRSQFSISATISCTIFPTTGSATTIPRRQKLFHWPRFLRATVNMLYASMGSITDPNGEKPKSTGNGIAVYKFEADKLLPNALSRLLRQVLRRRGRKLRFGLRTTPAGNRGCPYPAEVLRPGGCPEGRGDRLLIANNLSDNVVLLDVSSGEIWRIRRSKPEAVRA